MPAPQRRTQAALLALAACAQIQLATCFSPTCLTPTALRTRTSGLSSQEAPGPTPFAGWLRSTKTARGARMMSGSGKGGDEAGPLGKVAWVAAEALGNVASVVTGRRAGAAEEEEGVLEREVALERLRADYDRVYFISGYVDKGLYEKDCLFADPFASFRGRDRFVNNLSNLGLFISASDTRLLNFGTTSESPLTVDTRVMVRLQLRLPWNPVIAWVWGVKHVFGESGRIAEHIESWEVTAKEGLKQVFRPGPRGGLKPPVRKLRSDRRDLPPPVNTPSPPPEPELKAPAESQAE